VLGPTSVNNTITNFLFARNLHTRDIAIYPHDPATRSAGNDTEGTPFRPTSTGSSILYTALGFANLAQVGAQGNLAACPPRASDWNVTSGPYVNGATDGTAIGAHR
jgi:hypothetical protein